MATPPAKAPTAVRPVRRYRKLFQEDIWHHSMVFDNSRRGRVYAFLRVISITVRGVMTKKMFSQAAALSYASLMSLGPIISLAIMISTFALPKEHTEEYTTDMLNRIITFIAPSTSNLAANDTNNPLLPPAPAEAASPPPAESVSTTDTSAPDHQLAPVDDKPKLENSNAQLVALLNSFVTSAQHRSIGVAGLVILIFICIQMMISIENNFNNIWGVRRGRDMLRRIVLYWTVFSLGVLSAFTTATVLSAATLGSVVKHLPWGLDILGNFTGVTHVLAIVLLTLLLAVFYRFIPNTKVRWRPAFAGGLVVAVCLILNNYFSFLYVATVINKQSLYGSVGIIPILMFGLYVFWTMVLFGGVLTYAVQNANNITSDRLWNQVSPRTRRLLNLAAFLQIARAFLRKERGPTAEELAHALRVPAAILNEGLGRLSDLLLVSPVETTTEEGGTEIRYQPGRPLHQLTLGRFHHDVDMLGNSAGDETLEASDPLLPYYLEALGQFETGATLQQTFAELLKDVQPGVTKFPFRG